VVQQDIPKEVLAPTALAALAAPGYVHAFFKHRSGKIPGAKTNVWIVASLVLAVVAAAAAVVVSIPTGFGPILCLWALVMALRFLLV
jgi:hypothetical protein